MATIEFNGTGGLMEGDFGTNDININLDSVLNLSGTDEYLINSATAGENFRSSDASGTITAWIKPLATTGGSAPGNAVIFSASDEGSGSYYFKVMVRNDGKLWIRNRDSSTVYDLKGSNIIPDDVWTHVAVASNGSTTKMYINGVVETVVVDAGSNNGDWLGDMTGSKLDNVSIGAEFNDGGAGSFFKGAITDVRYFNAEINQPEIQIMASKMHTDHPDTVRTDQLKHWWKLNNSTIGAGTDELGDDYGDSGTTDIPLTPTNIVAGDIIYDAFSVNAQDTVTTDGTFTVTQGKLECKSLTSIHSENGNDVIELASTFTQDVANGATISFWWKQDTTGNYHTFIAADSSKYLDFGHNRSGQDGKYGTMIGSSGTVKSDSVTVDNDVWYHVVVVYEASGISYYQDGVAIGGTSGQSYSGNVLNGAIARLLSETSGGSYELDGNLRDMRFYDFAMSADQASSLYSGTYNVTPAHWWKLDDSIQGTNTTTVADSGTATAINGTLTNFSATNGSTSGASSNWNNNTLDLDNYLFVDTNGTLSAPRGRLEVTGRAADPSVEFDGTYIHNEGTFVPNNTSSTVFFKLGSQELWKLKTETTGQQRWIEDFTVLKEWESGGTNYLQSGKTYTFGDSTTQCTVKPLLRCILGTGPGNDTWCTLQGGDPLLPAIIESWDDTYGSNDVRVKWLKITGNMNALCGNPQATLQLIGDIECTSTMEVTTHEGNIDLNGHTFRITGNVSFDDEYPCNINYGGSGSMLYCSGNLDLRNAGFDNFYSGSTPISGVEGATIWMNGGHLYLPNTTSVLTVDTIAHGGDHTNGTYTNVLLEKSSMAAGGAGGSCRGTVVVSGGAVASVTIKRGGSGYAVNDSLIIDNATIGGAADATCEVATLATTMGNDSTNIIYTASGDYWPQSMVYAGNLTTAGGQVDFKSATNTVGNLVLGAGSTWDPEDKITQISGNYHTVGGIIGHSCMTTSGDNDYEGLRIGDNTAGGANDGSGSGMTSTTNIWDDKADWDFTGDAGATIETWVKFDDLTTMSPAKGLIAGQVRGRNDGTGNLYGIGMQIIDVGGTAYVHGIAGSNDGSWDDNCRFPLSDLTAGKWHHLALTVDNNNSSTPTGKLYLDAELKAQHTGASSIYFGYYFCVGGNAYNTHNQNWTARIDASWARMSAWNVELTQAQIRQLMFEDHAAATSSSTPHTNCRVWYQFDEGTGTLVDNKGVSGASHDGRLSTQGTGWLSDTDVSFTAFNSNASTIKMTGTDKYIRFKYGQKLAHDLEISGTVKWDGVGDNSASGSIYGDLSVTGTGTFSSNASEHFTLGCNLSGVSPTNNFTCDKPNTAIAGLQTLRTYSQDARIGACKVKNLACTEGPITLTGNVHCIQDFTASAGSTNIRTNSDGFDIKCRTMKIGTNTNANNYLELDKGSSVIFHDDAAGGFVTADTSNLNCVGSASTGFFNNWGNQVQPCVEVTEGIGQRWGFAGTDGKAFAVSFWIKRRVGATEGYIISTVYQPFNIRWSGRYLNLQFDVGTSGHVGETLVSTSTALSATNDTWEHVAISYRDDTKEAKFYVNGSLDSTRTLSGTVKEENVDSLIIGHYGGGTNSAQANLADVRLFQHDNQHCLDASAVTALYNSGSNPATNGEVYVADNSGDVPQAVGWWKLNEDSIGKAYDFSGNMHHGVNHNIRHTTGTYAAEFKHDGNTHISIPDRGSLDITGDMTMMAWVYYDTSDVDSSGFSTIISKASACSNTTTPWQMRIDDSHKLECVISNGSGSTRVSSTSALTTGWHHIALTIDESANPEVKYYIDGSLDKTHTFSSMTYGSYTNTNDVQIGILGVSGSKCYELQGKLADVRIYNQLLTADEIDDDIYKQGGGSAVNPATAGTYGLISAKEPVGWWKLGEEFTAIDSSSGTKREGVCHSGANPDRIHIMSEKTQAAPTNYWEFESKLKITASHTTFEKYDTFIIDNTGSNTVTIDNCTFKEWKTSGMALWIDNPGTYGSFTYNTFTHTGSPLKGIRFDDSPNIILDNIDLSGATFTEYDVYAYGGRVELDNSTFTISKAKLSNSSSIILSTNHTEAGSATVANDCQMVLYADATGLSSFSGAQQTKLASQNVTIYKNTSYSPNLKIDVTGKTFGGLIIPAGSVVTHESTHAFTVTGDVNITGSGALYTGGTGVPTFGSLTIGASGEYDATSGTTTITNKSTGNYSIENLGTFTHNNGKVLLDIDISANPDVKGNEFYDFEIDLASSGNFAMFRDLSGDKVTFSGDLIITKGKFDDNVNADEYVIHGNTIIETNGAFGTATNWHTGNITHHGLVVLNGGTYYRSSAGGTVKMGGIRNIGGSVL